MKKSVCLWIAVLVAAPATGLSSPQPNERQLAKGVDAFLAAHGDLCVGKYVWPREVTAEERVGGTNDALQLPVLERLGLVESAEIAQQGVEPVRRYSLTAQGQQYYLHKTRLALEGGERAVEHDADFCVARLSLDKVVRWTAPQQFAGEVRTEVSFTYRVEPAAWLSDPEARKVFPVVDRIIRGAGVLQMEAPLRLSGGKWLPALPGPPGPGLSP